MIHQYAELLTAEQLDRIHEASLEILDRVGLEVNNEKARDRFKKHGCRVDNTNNRVTFPPAVIEEFRKMTPPKFTFHARDPQFTRTVPDDAPLFITGSSAPNIIDPVTGKERWATSDDIARIAHLINELEGVDLFSVSTLADDAPSGLLSVTRFYTAIKNCKKPIRGSGGGDFDASEILNLAYAIAGGEEAYKEHPFITHHYCPIISPLMMDELSTELLMFYCEQGLPNHPTIVPIAGLTSPMTLTATLAQGNAEFLAALALMQMSKPGTPVLYSSLPTVVDMRSGAYTPGGVECGILMIGHAQLGRLYNIPVNGYIGLTNSKICDAQQGLEKSISPAAALMGGLHVFQMVGLLDALMVFDYATAVIDNDIAMQLKQINKGFNVSDEELALDLIEQVGPTGMFVGEDHTIERMKTTALFPDTANRDTRQMWMENGSKDAATMAKEKAREILSRKNSCGFDPELDARIREQFKDLVTGDVVIPEGWDETD